MGKLSILEKDIIQANPIIEAKKEMNVTEMRLFALGLQDIRPHITDNVVHDVDFHETVIPYRELKEIFGKEYNGNITNLKRQIKKASQCVIELSEENGGFGFGSIYRKIKYIPNVGLVIHFNDELKPYILELVNQAYTKYKIKALFSLSSTYAWRILELMLEKQGHFKKGVREVWQDVTIEKLRFYLNVPENLYKGRINNFRSRILDLPIEEINEKTDYYIWYEVQKTGRKVTGFRIWMRIREKKALTVQEVKQIEAKSAKALTDKQGELADSLINRGVGARVARKLVKAYPAEQIESNLKYCVERRESYKDLAATLVTAISEDWAGTAQKEKKEAQERIEKRQKERRQVYDDFHGTQMAGIGKTTKAKAKKQEKKPLTELGDFDVMMIQQKGEKAGKAILDRMKKLGLTVSEVKAGKRK